MRLRLEDHSRRNVKDVDCIVRCSPEDAGTYTELKSLQNAQNPTAAMKRSILMGVRQLERHAGATNGIAGGTWLSTAGTWS